MKVIIYDKAPGKGFAQWMLMMTWAVGSWIQELFGAADEVYAAGSWDEVLAWLRSRPGQLTSIQFWGHGSAATLWNGGKPAGAEFFLKLKDKVTPETVIWFRACSVFQGPAGIEFSQRLADGLGCTIAAHTRIVGFLQGGLYTRKPGGPAQWLPTEGELPGKLAPLGLKWGNRTVLCFATRIPRGW